VAAHRRAIRQWLPAGTAVLALFVAIASCDKADTANERAGDANELANGANGIAVQANDIARGANGIAEEGLNLSKENARKQEEADDRKLAESVTFRVDRRESESPPVVRVTVINNGITPIRLLRFESKGADSRVTMVPLRDVRECLSADFTVSGAFWNETSTLVFKDRLGRYWRAKEVGPVRRTEEPDSQIPEDRQTLESAQRRHRLIKSHGREALRYTSARQVGCR
jgi:hypothetical protein